MKAPSSRLTSGQGGRIVSANDLSGSENYDSSLCTPPKKCPKDFEYVQFAGDYDIGYFRNYNGPVLDPDNDAIDPQD